MGRSKHAMKRRRKASRKNMKGGGGPFDRMREVVAAGVAAAAARADDTVARGDDDDAAVVARAGDAVPAPAVPAPAVAVPAPATHGGGSSRTRRRGMYKRSRRSKTFKDLCSNIGNIVLPYGLLGIKKCSSRKKRSGRSRKYRHKR